MSKRRNNNYNNQQQRKNKQLDRQTKQRLRRERRMYGDQKWIEDWNKFILQVEKLGLTLKDVAGDGNCLFRAIGDQIEGNPGRHMYFRGEICDFIDNNRFDFEPFVEDDQDFDEYVDHMRTAQSWGGQMELQAASLRFNVNICIHQLEMPRWEIVNFAPTSRTIHLSYHDGDHYNSVRKIGDLTMNVQPVEIKFVEEKKKEIYNENNKNKEEEDFLTHDETSVIELTGCYNKKFIRKLLVDFWGDVNAVVEFILTVGPHDSQYQEEYVTGNFNVNENNVSNIDNTQFQDTQDYSQNYTKNNNQNNTKNNQNNRNNRQNRNQRNKQQPNTNQQTPPPDGVHPKLAKHYSNAITNKQRKEENRRQRQTEEINNKKAQQNNDSIKIVVDDLAEDIGSLQI